MAGFMQMQVTRKQRWLKVETTQGTEYVNVYQTGLDWPNSESMTEEQRQDSITQLQDYVEGEPESWENIVGCGARLSAPGYLDCTEWTVHETEEEGWEYLKEMYEDDEDNEDSGPSDASQT